MKNFDQFPFLVFRVSQAKQAAYTGCKVKYQQQTKLEKAFELQTCPLDSDTGLVYFLENNHYRECLYGTLSGNVSRKCYPRSLT
jgi:hypothetical protein